jgi:hypothetical protein
MRVSWDPPRLSGIHQPMCESPPSMRGSSVLPDDRRAALRPYNRLISRAVQSQVDQEKANGRVGRRRFPEAVRSSFAGSAICYSARFGTPTHLTRSSDCRADRRRDLTPTRSLHPDMPMYTFWHYLRHRWERDAELRLDHLLLNKIAAARLVEAKVDRSVRGELEQATMRRHGSGCRTSQRETDCRGAIKSS